MFAFRLTALCTALALALSTPALAGGKLESFRCRGSGVFGPTNIGTPEGGSFDLIIGDGSGITPYSAAGDADGGIEDIPDGDFSIGGERVGESGFNAHVGEVFSRTTGILKRRGSLVHWPAVSSIDHVLTSDEGEIHFQYVGRFQLDLNAFSAGESSFSGDALFWIVGGTQRFADASGLVWVDVQVPFPLPGLPPPGISPDIPFDYDFNGIIALHE